MAAACRRSFLRPDLFRWLLVLWLVTACESVPQPFRHDSDPGADPLSLIPSGVGVVVRPFSGAPGPAAPALADAMVRALMDADIFATTDMDEAKWLRYVLYASVEEVGRREGRVTLSVKWRVVGETVPDDESEARIEVDETSWRSATPALAGRIVAEPARRLIAQINEEALEPETPSPVVLLPILGLPADGNAALHAAMETALRRMGLEVRDKAPDGGKALLIEGRIALDPPKAAASAEPQGMRVKVTWTVKQADGAVLGSISQQNEVPIPMLQSPWGPLATAIAQGGAEGVSAFIPASR